MKTSKTHAQTNEILKYLETGRTITALDALKLFGCQRLAARIYDLKKRGYQFKTKLTCIERSVIAEYTLETYVVTRAGEKQMTLF